MTACTAANDGLRDFLAEQRRLAFRHLAGLLDDIDARLFGIYRRPLTFDNHGVRMFIPRAILTPGTGLGNFMVTADPPRWFAREHIDTEESA